MRAAGSKRCDQMRPHLQAIADSEEWGSRMIHAKSDIADQRGYTTYLDMYGVVKLPTVVLLRNGHPNMFPHDEPLEREALDAWLRKTIAEDVLPRDAPADAETVRLLAGGLPLSAVRGSGGGAGAVARWRWRGGGRAAAAWRVVT